MSGGKFYRRHVIVAVVAACSAGLLAGAGLGSRAVTADAADPASAAGSPLTGSPLSSAARPPAPPARTGLASCRAAVLRLTVSSLGVAAGSTYYSIHFTNMSGRACSLEGYPKASFVSAAGRQIGAAAGHDPAYPRRQVILRPGHDAHARLRAGTPWDYPVPACHPVTVRWLRVYVPADRVPLYAGFAGMACADAAARILGVSRVQPGWGAWTFSPGGMGR